MVEFFQSMHPVLQALVATGFTWLMTALGAAVVFLVRGVERRLLDVMLGFAAGVMLAASYWALLEPAIEMSRGTNLPVWFPAAAGLLLGAGVLRLIDRVLPHLHLGLPIEKAEGVSTSWRRSTLLILAITLHNIPEGLAVGVAFGAAASGLEAATTASAIALAIGLGIQNFPEGLAVSMPLRREGLTRLKSFWYGQLSGLVEPAAGVAGAAAVLLSRALMPYALGFAAGAMIFVVIEEVIPESQSGGNGDLATAGAMIGFVVMMILDISFQ
ncbi:MAG TPA: ZIP family metal transporter [Candidatus Eisenbacteria bacterium]|uniref:ZIP family metal transporter n=1 Tax=Eiseniibacteriota bacterium TaxID=2212470 RepID=A0A7V2AV40_UNCEI|nr:ZIP family metal transporter [Candidatus Eisenbacteria bacterium]